MVLRAVSLTPRIRSPLIVAILMLLGAAAAEAGPVLGFREDWTGTSTDGWAGGGGGGSTISNPGANGLGGAGDGFLLITQADAGPYGSRSTGPEYTGDWAAAGIERVRVSLNDVGADDAFEIHVCIGNTSNFWQYNPGFVPPNGAWQEFEVDLTDASQWTQIIGSGAFTEALQFADRILLRNDSAPFMKNPDLTSGDLGIDGLQLRAVSNAVRVSTWGRIKRLYR